MNFVVSFRFRDTEYYASIDDDKVWKYPTLYWVFDGRDRLVAIECLFYENDASILEAAKKSYGNEYNMDGYHGYMWINDGYSFSIHIDEYINTLSQIYFIN